MLRKFPKDVPQITKAKSPLEKAVHAEASKRQTGRIRGSSRSIRQFLYTSEIDPHNQVCRKPLGIGPQLW